AGTLAKRFFLPWQSPGVEPEFVFEVKPGDAYAARGYALPFAVTLKRRDSRVVAPDAVQLAFTYPNGSVKRHTLRKAEGDDLRYEGSAIIEGDIEYRAEAGNWASNAYLITSITPVDLAPDSPKVTITPPEYARVTVETTTITGLGDLQALANSELAFTF